VPATDSVEIALITGVDKMTNLSSPAYETILNDHSIVLAITDIQ